MHGFDTPATDRDVEEFRRYGTLEYVHILGDFGLHLGFRNLADASEALQAFDNFKVRGTSAVLRVEYSDEPFDQSPERRRSPSPPPRRSPDRFARSGPDTRRLSYARALSPPPFRRSPVRDRSPVRGSVRRMSPSPARRSPVRRAVSPVHHMPSRSPPRHPISPVNVPFRAPPPPPPPPTTIKDLPIQFTGKISLKNSVAAVNLHYVAGDSELVRLLPVAEPMEIKQRMRLDQGQQKFENSSLQETCILIVSSSTGDEQVLQLVKYLIKKEALGLFSGVNVTAYIFPDCEFVRGRLSDLIPTLRLDEAMDERLLVILSSV